MPQDVIDLSYGMPAPGEAAIKGNDIVWLGREQWRTQHGKAWSYSRLGLLTTVLAVKTPHGRRDDLVRSEPGSGLWCYAEPSGLWQHGELELDREDIEFHPSTAPLEKEVWAEKSMALDLIRSDRVSDVAKDKAVADSVYSALCDGLWTNDKGRQATFTWRSAASVVSRIRKLHEPTCEFLHNGREGEIANPEVLDILAKEGWSLLRPFDSVSDKRLRAERLVRACESRPPVGTPEWLGDHIAGVHPSHTDNDLGSRLHRAAFSGKVSHEEWDMFWQMSYSRLRVT